MPNRKATNISEAKLNRLLEYNRNLREQLDIPRITISEASSSLISFCNETKDPLVPSVWGPIEKKDDPFAPSSNNGCCILMKKREAQKWAKERRIAFTSEMGDSFY